MNCNHQFFRIEQITKMPPNASTTATIPISQFVSGYSAACVNCGQVRKVFEDGEVRVTKPGNPEQTQGK